MTTQNTPIQLKNSVTRWRILSPGESPEDRLKLVDAPTLKEWIDRDTVLLVDVREPAEHAGEHIPGSILLPLSKFDPTQMPTASDKNWCSIAAREIDRNKPLKNFWMQVIWKLPILVVAWATGKSKVYQLKSTKMHRLV
jgi:Rhodanese-like domain